MSMRLRNNAYWLIAIATGLMEATVWVAVPRSVDHYSTTAFGLHILTPGIFGGVFAFCVWKVAGTSLIQALGTAIAFIAAHNLGFKLAVSLTLVATGGPVGLLIPTTYGATVAIVASLIVAFVKPTASGVPLLIRTVIAAGIVAHVIWPLEQLLPGGFIGPSAAALGVAFGLVYATIAAFSGWHLLRKPIDNSHFKRSL